MKRKTKNVRSALCCVFAFHSQLCAESELGEGEGEEGSLYLELPLSVKGKERGMKIGGGAFSLMQEAVVKRTARFKAGCV